MRIEKPLLQWHRRLRRHGSVGCGHFVSSTLRVSLINNSSIGHKRGLLEGDGAGTVSTMPNRFDGADEFDGCVFRDGGCNGVSTASIFLFWIVLFPAWYTSLEVRYRPPTSARRSSFSCHETQLSHWRLVPLLPFGVLQSDVDRYSDVYCHNDPDRVYDLCAFLTT